MPPRSYLLTHPEARLTDSELAALADAWATTFGEENEDESRVRRPTGSRPPQWAA